MDIAAQVSTYFGAPADATHPGEVAPSDSSGNTVTPMIDGRRYFRAMRALLQSLGKGPSVSKQFFYVAGWWLHLPASTGASLTTAILDPAGRPQSATTFAVDTMGAFSLVDDTSGPHPVMARLLAEKAAAGVDVRVMGWVNPFVLRTTVSRQPGLSEYWNVVVGTIRSIDHLRKQKIGTSTPMADRVCALTIGHTLGAFHLKLVIAHDGTRPWAFTGGIDFVPNRVAGEMHPPGEWWHDMAVAVDGPAVQTIYDLYRNLWNEQMGRPAESFQVGGDVIKSVETGTASIPARSLPGSGTGKHHVQVARTLPQYNFSPTGFIPSRPKLSFAPGGVFEVIVVWRKAISAATRYIYIEDQSFYSRDVMDFINARLKQPAARDLKVILLMGDLVDPSEPPHGIGDDPALVEAINNHLLSGLSASQIEQIGFFVRRGVFVHAKATIIDDHWLLAGSANCMRRSLFTDGELSVAVLDEDDALAKKVRTGLWGGHFGRQPGVPRNPLDNLENALAVWNAPWGSAPPFSRPAALIKLSLPLPAATTALTNYDFLDADSRKTP